MSASILDDRARSYSQEVLRTAIIRAGRDPEKDEEAYMGAESRRSVLHFVSDGASGNTKGYIPLDP